MKLLNDLFSILESAAIEGGFVTQIRLDPEHLVYTGHFPGFPVTPGVIQLQIVHELLEFYLGRKLSLQSLPQCKFLKVLNPLETPEVSVFIQWEAVDGRFRVKAWGEYFRLNGEYRG